MATVIQTAESHVLTKDWRKTEQSVQLLNHLMMHRHRNQWLE